MKQRKMMKEKRKIIFSAIVYAFAFGGGICFGVYYAKPHNVEQALDMTQKYLETELMEGDAPHLGQVHLNFLAQCLNEISYMQCDWIGLEICNSDYYSEIETVYLKEYESWHKSLHAAEEKPSQYEGGSMAPMDDALRIYSMRKNWLHTLKTKYRRK